MVTTVQSNKPDLRGADASGPVLVLRLRKKTRGRYPLTSRCMTIGRAHDADIRLQHSTGVSRRHAHVLVVDEEVVVEDLGSRNGTFVNGKLTTRRTLKPGDRITIGHYRLFFLHQGARQRKLAPPETELSRLMRRWGRAAVTTDVSGCPLCHAADSSPAGDTETGTETGEHVRIDEGCYEWFNDPIVALAGNVGDGATDGSATDPPAGDDNFPRLDVVEDAVGGDEALDEDEMMARVERLVGLGPGNEPQRPAREEHDADCETGIMPALEEGADDDDPAVDAPQPGEAMRGSSEDGDSSPEEADDRPAHGARDRIQSRRPDKRRASTRRTGLVRRGRLR